MTFKKLFERLRKQELNCAIAELHLNELKDGKETGENMEYLAGFLCGLNTAKLITDDEERELHNIITNFFD